MMNCFNPAEKSTMPVVPLSSKNRYQRLRHEKVWDDDEIRVSQSQRPRSWFRFRFRSRALPNPIRRRRFRLKIPSLRRLWRKRAFSMRISYSKVLKRFKEGQVHFGDLFAGNYLFMHVNPTSLKCIQRDFALSKIA